MANSKEFNPHLKEWFEKNDERLNALIYDIWSHPEVGLKEYYCAQAVKKFALEEGFETVKTYCAEDWANQDEACHNTMIATWGSGKPVIAIVGELDALPGLGQAPNKPCKAPVDGPGHGCGHNLISGGAAGGASALRYAMEKEHLPGTIKLIEAPAEEIGVGKTYLRRNHVFDDVDIAVMWHAGVTKLDYNDIPSITVYDVTFEFHGKSAHAMGAPHGRSALDAVTLMNIGCEFMREHIDRQSYLHYNILDGGKAANIVPDYAAVHYMFRTYGESDVVKDIFERAVNVAKGAALMTGTTVEYKINSVLPHFYWNAPLGKFFHESARCVPVPELTAQETAFLTEVYRNTRPEADMSNISMDDIYPMGLAEYTGRKEGLGACTDMSAVSFFCPTIHPQGPGMVPGAGGHSWSVSAVAGMSAGAKAGIYGYMTIAQGAYDALKTPEVIEEAWEYQKKMNIPEFEFWLR